MTVDGYNRFCRSLTATTHVVQWGGAHVWKVAGKVFAIAWFDADDPDDEDELLVTFKVSDMSFELLKEMPGCRPAPYLASRGMKWIQRTGRETLDDKALRDYITESHRIVALGLAKRMQKELGIGIHAAPVEAAARTETPKRGSSQKSKAAAAKPSTQRAGAKLKDHATDERRAASKSAITSKSQPKPKSQRARVASRGEAA